MYYYVLNCAIAPILSQATNLSFMIEYGNPQLANGEAGYYLTTLEAAVQFIVTLTPDLLQLPSGYNRVHTHLHTVGLVLWFNFRYGKCL